MHFILKLSMKTHLFYSLSGLSTHDVLKNRMYLFCLDCVVDPSLRLTTRRRKKKKERSKKNLLIERKKSIETHLAFSTITYL